jgi:hypothetical protein
MQYGLSKDEVMKADQEGAKFITETGKYIGKFFYAIPSVSKEKGTKGIEFGFRTKDGLEASYLRLWIESAQGEKYFGLGVLNGIMASLRLKGINAVQGKYEQWSKEEKQAVIKTGECFPELQNKPIGLLMRKVHDFDKDGNPKTYVEIVSAFDASTEQTPAEIIEGKPAGDLANKVAALTDRYVKPKKTNNDDWSNYSSSNQGESPLPGDDQDIPW